MDDLDPAADTVRHSLRGTLLVLDDIVVVVAVVLPPVVAVSVVMVVAAVAEFVEQFVVDSDVAVVGVLFVVAA